MIKPLFRCSCALIVWLAGCSTGESGGESGGAAPTSARSGEQIYAGSCVPCHQADGRGIPGVYPSLAGSPVVQGDPRELARWVIEGQRPASMPAARFVAAMPRFGWLQPPAAAALFTYLRSHFGNAAPAVDAVTIAQAVDH